MAKEERNYNQEFKKLNIFMYIIMALLLIICILCLVNACSKNNTSKSDYDTSMMREVGVEDVLDLFSSSDTYVLYIGRETCDICLDLLPKLQEAQINNNYITQYLDISKVDRTTSNWEKLVNLLNLEVSTTMDANGEGEVVTNTFGYFLNEKGFTPCVIIISNGKQIAGFFGDKDSVTLEDWLANYGI